MTCPVSSMTRDEVRNECKVRMGKDETNLNAALTEYALKLKFTDNDAQKLRLPTLKVILKHLRILSAS